MTEKNMKVRSTDNCAGEDCPQFLRQENIIAGIQTGQKLIIALLVCTIGFHAYNFISFMKFMEKHNSIVMEEQKTFSSHLIEMVKMDSRIKDVEDRCEERGALFLTHVTDFNKHLEKYHR